MEVFVQEQGVPEAEEIDGLDPGAIHVLATLDGAPVATGRLVLESNGRGRIGRMAVRRVHRGQGVGTAVLEFLLELARQHGINQVSLAAQLHAIRFYERLGFTAEGEVFLDAGISHRMMTRAARPGLRD